MTPTDNLSGEISWAKRFDQGGVFAQASIAHDYDLDWYQILGVGGSTGGSFWPQFTVSTELFRKWLPNRSLISGVGINRNTYHFGASDLGFLGELIYYFPIPVVAEGGYRYNLSSPGSVPSHREFLALTLGYGWAHSLVAKFDTGTEAYQPVGIGTIATEFTSHALDFRWRSELDALHAISLDFEHYWNPFYNRNTVSLSLSRRF